MIAALFGTLKQPVFQPEYSTGARNGEDVFALEIWRPFLCLYPILATIENENMMLSVTGHRF